MTYVCPTCHNKRFTKSDELVTFDWDGFGSPRQTRKSIPCPDCTPHIEGVLRLTFGRCWCCGAAGQVTTDHFHQCLSCRSRNEAQRIKEVR